MNKKISKLIIYITIAIILFILVVYSLGLGDTIENIIILIVSGVSATMLIISFFCAFQRDFKKLAKLGGTSLLGLAITYGLISWNSHNEERRWQRKGVEIEIKDSIQHHNDSIQIIEDSKRLYKQEGDSIFGDFYFGMTQEETVNIVNTIKSETNGRISIAGYDFVIDSCKFYNNKLYLIRLKSAKPWERYYSLEDLEYEDLGLNNGESKIKEIVEHLSKKYGEPNYRGNWHFTYKDIDIHSEALKKRMEGLLVTEYWGVVLTIKKPEIAEIVEKEEEERYKKAMEEMKAKDEEMKAKKESFSKGL